MKWLNSLNKKEIINKNDNCDKKEKEFVDYLNRYSLRKEPIKLVSDFKEIENANIPMYWKKSLLTSDIAQTKKIILEEWKKHCANELSNTINYLDKYIKKIDLMCLNDEYSLIYTISSNETKKDMYYEGKNPMDSAKYMSKELESVWSGLDKALTGFYENVHNGFNYYSCKCMGLDSTNDIDSMANYDWEFIDSIDYDLTYLFNFFSNGMGTYVVLDTKKDVLNGAYLWSKLELPTTNLNFWNCVDEWLVIGFDF